MVIVKEPVSGIPDVVEGAVVVLVEGFASDTATIGVVVKIALEFAGVVGEGYEEEGVASVKFDGMGSWT